MTRICSVGVLLLSSMTMGALLPSWAGAQTAASDSATDNDALGEVVVTATRRSDTVNRVPLSITAITQDDLAKAEVRTIDDIRLLAPGIGLSFGTNSARASVSGDTNLSIRGIESLTGAATTGVYIDDIPVYKTAVNGSGFGAAYPGLFDLDRVEVLRGPQGTLFGGSTEGGAIRFITAQPSLVDTSAQVKAEGSGTEGGDPSYEFGGAFGTPIINDVLGVRLNLWDRHAGGWLDHVSQYTGNTLAKNTNAENADMVRLSLLWSPIENLNITPSYFHQDDLHSDTDQYWQNTPAFNAPAVGLNDIGNARGPACPTANTNPAACPGYVPAHTYGPYNMFGPGKTGTNTVLPNGQEVPNLDPRNEHTDLASLTFDYDLGPASVKSITGFFKDDVTGTNWQTYVGGDPIPGDSTYPSDVVFTYPYFWQYTNYQNTFRRFTQEFRAVSKDNTRLTWVTGLYFSSSRLEYSQQNFDNSEQQIPALRGGESYFAFEGFQPYGIEDGSGNPAQKDNAHEIVKEQSVAAYLDATYSITDQWKLTAGVRGSHDKQNTLIELYGDQDLGALVAVPGTPSHVQSSGAWTPVTPRANMSYQLTDHAMVYTTVATGYRDGGSNAVNQAQIAYASGLCSSAQVDAIPSTYNPDRILSSEVGAKVNVLGFAQINTSVYNIDWSNVQTFVATPRCGQYIVNAGDAVSRGFDLQAEVRPFDRLTVTSTISYDDDRFTKTLPEPAVFGNYTAVQRGNLVPNVPRWTYNIAGNYNFTILGKGGYFNVDYEYIGTTVRSTGPGTVGYTPNVYEGAPINFANARVGTTLFGANVALFVKNLTNSTSPLLETGGASITRPVAPLVFAQTFRPREIGLSLTKKW